MVGPADYSEKVMDHFMHPRNVGEIPDADGMGRVGNPICVVPSTLVHTNCSVTPIKDILSGGRVLSADGRYHTIKNIYSRNYSGGVYTLGVHNLGEVTLTPEHHVLALRTRDVTHKFRRYRNFIPDWMMAGELRKGDIVLYPILRDVEDKEYIVFDVERPKLDFKSKDLPDRIKITEDFLRLIGYYLAEGYVRTDPCKGTVGFVFGAKERDYVEDVVKLMDDIFNVSPARYNVKNNAISISFYSARLARFFERHFGKGAQSKHLPHWMILLPAHKQKAILCGFWRGDVSINKRRAKYNTISKQLSYQIAILLLRQRIIFSYLTVPANGIHKENYHIYVKSIPSLKKLADIVGVNLPSKIRGGHKAWYDDNYFYTPIKYIKRSNYTGQIYNLEVGDNHSYVTNAAVLHNCGDIMALYIKVDNNIITDAKFKTFGCLPADEEVVYSNGGWKRISKVLVGDTAVNSEGEQTRVAETYVRGYEGDLVKIIPFVSPYNSFSLTPEHPVLAIKRDDLRLARKSRRGCDWLRVNKIELLNTKPYFVNAGSLEKSDYLIYAFNDRVLDNPSFTIDKMRLIGYYLSEGYISAGGSVVAFAFNKKEREIIEDVKGLINKIIGKEAKERMRGNVTEVYVCSRKLARFLCSAGNKLAKNKSISEEILSLPFEKQWEMIKTYISGDGDTYRRRLKDSETYRIKTVSKNLAIQIQEILARGSIFPSIREQNISSHLIEGRKIGPSKVFVISFKLHRRHKFVHMCGGYFLVPIRKIERKYFEGPVYNFQVSSEPNTYLVKGFAVHNCGAAIATSSMVTELVKGKTVEEALKISNKAVAEALGGLPPIKMHCSLLAEQALKAALEDYYQKKGLPLPWPKKELEKHEHEIFEK